MLEVNLKSPEKSKPARIGLKAIGKAANVSVATVSMALSDHPDVNVDTKRRIWRLSSEMGYQAKNRPAVASLGNLKSVGFMLLGTAAPDINDTSILGHLIFACGKLGIALQVAGVEAGELHAAPERSLSVSRNVDALILMNYVGNDTLGALNAAGVPYVVIGYSTATPRQAMEARVHVVSCDDAAMGQTATDALIQTGHQRIGFVCETMPPELCHWRVYSGYIDAHRAAGLPVDPQLLFVAGEEKVSGNLFATAFAKLESPPTGFVIPDARIAAAFLKAMRERGTPVPRDNIVINADPGSVDRYGIAHYPLVLGDYQEVANAGLRLLQGLFNDRSSPASTLQVSFKTYNLPQSA